MLQNIVVALIVGAAVLFALSRWLPAAIRRPALALLASGARAAHLPSFAQRLDPAANTAAGCGTGCESCGSCESSAAPEAARRAIPIKSVF